jgi:hypothetical protein
MEGHPEDLLRPSMAGGAAAGDRMLNGGGTEAAAAPRPPPLNGVHALAASSSAYAAPPSPRTPSAGAAAEALARLKDAAAAGRARALPYSLGTFGFGALAFLAGAAPGLLPAAFLLFAGTAMPLRFIDFCHKKWQFFTIDFCYFVNGAAAAHLLLTPDDAAVEAMVYALCDGPLAAALAAWQCAWVFGDSEHTVRWGARGPAGSGGAAARARPVCRAGHSSPQWQGPPADSGKPLKCPRAPQQPRVQRRAAGLQPRASRSLNRLPFWHSSPCPHRLSCIGPPSFPHPLQRPHAPAAWPRHVRTSPPHAAAVTRLARPRGLHAGRRQRPVLRRRRRRGRSGRVRAPRRRRARAAGAAPAAGVAGGGAAGVLPGVAVVLLSCGAGASLASRA